MPYSITELATIANISTRTLRHYDEIGLLKSYRDPNNNYRSYTEQDVIRLQTILLLKKMEFPLHRIQQMIDSSYLNFRDFLDEAKTVLQKKSQEVESLLTSLDSYKKMEPSIIQNTQAHKESGMDEEMAKYRSVEAFTKWGDSDAYRQSIERTKKFTKSDWEQIKKEQKEITLELAQAMPLGPHSQQAQKAILAYHKHINRFYDISLDHFENLGNMYIADPRFKETFEHVQIGLAKFIQETINIYTKQKNSSE